MKTGKLFMMLAACSLALLSCSKAQNDGHGSQATSPDGGLMSLRGVARMLASLPIGEEQLSEVWDAVSSSSGNGYDEEYMMCDLVGSPGAGVGDSPESRARTRAAYKTPLRDLIADYYSAHALTRAGGNTCVQALLEELSSSGMQIYWPYSEEWDGEQRPLITFDPGYGAASNYAYEIAWKDGSYEVLDSVYVDENVAASRPVWVVNRNDDSGFTPLELFTRSRSGASLLQTRAPSAFDEEDESSEVFPHHNLLIKDFTMLRQYDSWFCGASEFFIQAGSLYARYADTEVEPGSFTPEVTQLMIVVRRNQVGKKVPFEALLLSGFPDQLEQFALLITESDGGTRTSWKCSAKVMIKSKSYGADIEIPFYTNDDIVWRGAVGMDYLRSLGTAEGRFGDVRISFDLQ